MRSNPTNRAVQILTLLNGVASSAARLCQRRRCRTKLNLGCDLKGKPGNPIRVASSPNQNAIRPMCVCVLNLPRFKINITVNKCKQIYYTWIPWTNDTVDGSKIRMIFFHQLRVVGMRHISHSSTTSFIFSGDVCQISAHEQWKKTSCLGYIGDYTPQLYGIIINHCKDPYQTTRIQWKVRWVPHMIYLLSWLDRLWQVQSEYTKLFAFFLQEGTNQWLSCWLSDWTWTCSKLSTVRTFIFEIRGHYITNPDNAMLQGIRELP